MWINNVIESILSQNKIHYGLNYFFIIITLFSILVQWLVGIYPYSGWKQGPMFGDFEAQRHWLEVTLGLPPREWYFFDLKYWGLDYPPLTAYHSWLLGKIALAINPDWVALNESRGYESISLKHYMRSTSIASQLVVYTLFAYLLSRRLFYKRTLSSARESLVAFFIIVLQPGLLLIDHGHFQYNSVMLGYAVGFLWAVYSERLILGSVLFCLSLAFKQMALFYALPIFTFLLGKCATLKFPQNAILLAKLGATVIATFTICVAVLLVSAPVNEWSSLLVQMLVRLFPVQRGLYEDKVANVWCAISVVVKLRNWLDLNKLVALSTYITFAAVVPSCVLSYRAAFRSPFTDLVYSLFLSSLAFFLLGFQVHEKSILLPLMPATVLMAMTCTGQFKQHGRTLQQQMELRLVLLTFTNVACFSMYPLIQKDLLHVPYVVVLTFWNLALMDTQLLLARRIILRLAALVHLAMLAVHLMDAFLLPPKSLPHLFIMFNVVLSCAVFCFIWVYLFYTLWVSSSAQIVPLKNASAIAGASTKQSKSPKTLRRRRGKSTTK